MNKGIIMDYAISEKGNYLISNSKDGHVKLYDVSNGAILNQMKNDKFLNLNCIKINKNKVSNLN